MNIFGKNPLDYEHLQVLNDAGKLNQHLAKLKEKNTALFDAKPMQIADDTQGFGYLTNNLMAIRSEILEVLYTDYRLPNLVPMQTAIPEGATSYAYRVTNKFGEGAFVENYGTDAKGAGVDIQLINANLYLGVIDASWSLEDLRNAAFSGFALDSMTIEAATFGAIKHIEQVVLTGSTQKGLYGLTNQPGITINPAPAPFSASSDGQAIVTLINNQISDIVERTNEVFGGVIKENMTIYLPVNQFNYISTLAYGVNKDKTVMEYLKKFNSWTTRTEKDLQFKSVIELKGAGSGGSDRMLVGFNNLKVMEFGQSIAPRITSIVNYGIRFVAPLEYKFSGLNVKQPGGMIYVDGI